ncbi:sulfatase-like hydrolase/transferase [Paenibacillus doosanensis]|uniref:Lipoteichoic acid synthase 2 n=1 Tax=Paenibacillus konkukensis TaxID=2020716 RepID=A0ABY4RM39_9BACL|nr:MULTISPECIES: LTA synthase family protein [Paenibacillus]MCS7461705.1 sulfatase-like hydrolase/transferase [Paenibacillus doosanensis]UQZ83547.1 Lipoteichoic acid synthase 2 [Paenibacillus konkukensis]
MEASWVRIWRSPYIIITLLLWVKVALLRYFLFDEVIVSWWLLDLASLAVLSGCVELLFRYPAKKTAYWIVNAVMSLIFFAATLYFEHFGSVITYTSVLEIKQVLQISSSVKATIRLADYLFFLDFAVFFLLWLVFRRSGAHILLAVALRKYAVIAVTAACLIVCAVFIKLNLGIVNELVRANQLGLLNYEASVLANSIKGRKTTNFSTTSEALNVVSDYEASYGYNPNAGETPKYFGSQQGKNVIVVQLEAFQNFPIHLNFHGQEVTPVLNKLAAESYYFPHIFQQIGQGNTSDAEFMSNTSIYPTGTIPMSTGYGDRVLPSLPRLLEAIGYEADTFHVNEVHFWDRYKLYPALGFTHYYDKPYYNNDFFNSFGASDEELFRVGAEKLSELHKQGKPFYAQFITVSSHFPFKIPNDRRKMTIPADLEGKQLGDYLLSVNYTDYAVGTFIDRLKAAGIWDNTIFVAYGDHFGLQPEDNDPKELSEQLGMTYHPVISRFNIPLFIHVPGQTAPQVVNQVGGQLDIMPTITNLLGISLQQQQFLHFGQDLLNMRHNVLGMRYYMPTGSFFNNIIMFQPGKAFDDGTAVTLRTLAPANIQPYRSDFDYIMNLMKMSDDYVKLLPKR